MQRIVVFSDLDGTLLNHNDYSCAAARPALQALRERDIPLILVSSKTSPEMLQLRAELNSSHPLVCENGCLIMIPEERISELGVQVDSRALSDGYYYDYRGVTREEILLVLTDLKSDYDFTGFAWMTDQEVVDATGLSPETAGLARERKASEPILWRDDPKLLPEFVDALADNKLRLLEGGRFYHVMGQCDKGDAVRSLLKRYEHHYGTRLYSIALGDSPNDLEMLKAVDQPVIMPDSEGAFMEDDALTGATRAPEQGATGWNQAVLGILKTGTLS